MKFLLFSGKGFYRSLFFNIDTFSLGAFMNQKAMINNARAAETRIQALCRALEEGGIKRSDGFIAFSKMPENTKASKKR